MTCIAGVRKGKTVFLGGDSAATSGDGSQTIIADPKVFVKGSMAFGICGLPKVMDLVAHAFELPERQGTSDARQYLVKDVIPALQACLAEGGALDGDSNFHGEMLLGYDGGLYRLQGNFQLIVAANDHAAVGSGADIALGSLHRSSGNPRSRIEKALEASATNNATVRPPFRIVSVTGR